MARLYDFYKEEVVSKMKEKFHYRNPMQVPKVEKIVINMGVGEAIDNIKVLDSAAEEIGMIGGQKAVITKARKSISNFKPQGRRPDRGQGHAPQGPDVLFPRQAHGRGDPEVAGFQGGFPKRIRRTGELYAWHKGTDYIS